MHEPFTVVFTGGGTGGHLYPALALADALQALRADVHCLFVGAQRGIEARVLPEQGRDHVLLPIRGLDRSGGLRANVGLPGAVLRSFVRARRLLRERGAEVVVVTGGYAAAPAGFMAASLRIPLVLQEQNAVPGLTTRLLARRARRVHVAYPEVTSLLPASARGRVKVSGNPIRPPVERDAGAARASLGLEPHRPTVLVVGGSQGSVALNRAVGAWLEAAPEDPGFQLLWATGPRNVQTARAIWTAAGTPAWVAVHGYLSDMPGALAASDLAVSRAGAMATSEFLAWGLPAVLVPLPSAAADHQTLNAAALARAGCAVHLPQAELTGSRLREAVLALMGEPNSREAMAERARSRSRPGAVTEIAADIAGLLPAAPGRSP